MRPNKPAASRESLPPIPEEFVTRSGVVARPLDPAPPRAPMSDRRPRDMTEEDVASALRHIRAKKAAEMNGHPGLTPFPVEETDGREELFRHQRLALEQNRLIR